MANKTPVYKILSEADWLAAQALGHTRTALDVADGYVHLSGRETVAETLRLHYAGQSGVRLLAYSAETLDGDVRWELSRGGQLFPHLYGRLMLSGAEQAWVLGTDAGGNPVLPEEI